MISKTNEQNEYEKKKQEILDLMRSTNRFDHETILQMLIEAGNETGIIFMVFDYINLASVEFIKYIFPKVIEHQYYRYSCVFTGLASCFELTYPVNDKKKWIFLIADILSGDYQKYLDTFEPSISLTLLTFLPMVDEMVFKKYFNECLVSSDKYKRFIAFYYLSHTKTSDMLEICNNHFYHDDLEIYASLLDCIPSFYRYNNNDFVISNEEIAKELILKLCTLEEKLPKKKVVFNASKEIWFTHSVSRGEILDKIVFLLDKLKNKELIQLFEDKYYPALDSDCKIDFLFKLKNNLTLDYRKEILRNFNSYRKQAAFSSDNPKNPFLNSPLTFREGVELSQDLKSNNSDLKKYIIEHFQKMNKNDMIKLKEYLLKSNEDSIKEAALDLVTSSAEDTTETSTSNEEAFSRFINVSTLDLTEERIIECFNALEEFVIKNADHKYRSPLHGETEFGLRYSQLENSTDYPLQNESNELIKSFNLTHDEIVFFEYALRLMEFAGDKSFKSKIGKKFDKLASLEKNCSLSTRYFINMLSGYLKSNNSQHIQKAYVHRYFSVINSLLDEFVSFEFLTKYNLQHGYRFSYNKGKMPPYCQEYDVCVKLSHNIEINLLDEDTLLVFSQILKCTKHYFKSHLFPSQFLDIFSCFYDKKIIDNSELFEFLKKGYVDLPTMYATKMRQLTHQNDIRNIHFSIKDDGYLDMLCQAIMLMLDTEMSRNQAETSYSEFITRAEYLIGVSYYLKALQAFQSMTIMRRTKYRWCRNLTKVASFSNIVQSTTPYETDTYDDFLRLVGELKLTTKDLIKGALLNDSWTILEWTDRFLGLNGLISTIMFFKAHLRDDNVSNCFKDKIAIYSPIDIDDFKEGAVDIDWFWQVKREADDATFNLIYDNAKYITVTNFHKRAQRFNDALTKKLTAEECLSKINQSRSKEYILYYSLIPLENECDIDDRYAQIMQFLHESKQFGAQRQASEKKASEIAIENLARACGYSDVDRFVWFMESKSADRIAPYFTAKEIGDFEVSLFISERFKVSIAVTKNGNEMSTVPTSVKNDAYYSLLKAEREVLNKQSTRVIKSLETVMERSSILKASELAVMSKSPLIKKILGALFYLSADAVYTFDELMNSALTDCIIAHPLDLYRLKVWGEKQKYLLMNKIRQPFKQAFRETYTKMEDEKIAQESNRYHGRLINLQKAIAVAKSRGWHSGEDIGLQKVFYKENIVAVIFGVWDFGYSSFDNDESVTVSSIYFVNRKTFNVISLKDIDDKMFSEVMRDVDLVVSTSHPQGYDFEESLSTVELRRQICMNLAELLYLNNILVDGNFVKIKGKLGDYAINLRSGVAFKNLTGALNILAISDPTHNKVFLDFIDDNPLTVEVISKMLLLSDDTKIKDPNIIREINK
ncbi:MAG: DUF4132 domain-containing protein [Christensenellaceae bacterium]|nr:DUF4132 domain-containing protein [Christensenellaceae bacterium]